MGDFVGFVQGCDCFCESLEGGYLDTGEDSGRGTLVIELGNGQRGVGGGGSTRLRIG